MKLFARSDVNSPRIAYQRAEKLMRASFKVQKFTHNDWMASRPNGQGCLVTLWGYVEPEFERHVHEGAVDGLIWDLAWCAKRRGLSQGALALAKGAAGRGNVELSPGDLLNPSEVFFYDRLLTPVDFDEVKARQFLTGCADAVERIDKALRHG